MYQLVPTKCLWIVAAWVAITIAVLLDSATSLSLFSKAKYAVAGANIVLVVLTLSPVWRLLWRIPFISLYFPDLNGIYDVEYQSNWPIQNRMLLAASGRSESYDPLAPNVRPALETFKARALIEASFYSVRIRMVAADLEDSRMTIESSRTLAVTLIKASAGEPNRLAYVYQQKNRRERQVIGDDSVFEGAAVISIRDRGDILEGEYWTNRAWQSGLSTAGKLIFRRTRTAPLIGTSHL